MSDRFTRRDFLTRFARKAAARLSERIPDIPLPSRKQPADTPAEATGKRVAIFAQGSAVALVAGKLRVEADSGTGLWNFLYEPDPFYGIRGAAFGVVAGGRTLLSSGPFERQLRTDPVDDELGRGMALRLILAVPDLSGPLALSVRVYEDAPGAVLRVDTEEEAGEIILLAVEPGTGKIEVGEEAQIFIDDGIPGEQSIQTFAGAFSCRRACTLYGSRAVICGFLEDDGLIRISSMPRLLRVSRAPSSIARLWLDLRPDPLGALAAYGEACLQAGHLETWSLPLPVPAAPENLPGFARQLAVNFHHPREPVLDFVPDGETPEGRTLLSLLALTGRPGAPGTVSFAPTGKAARPLDLFRGGGAERWAARMEKQWGAWWVFSLFNPGEEAQAMEVKFADIGQDGATPLLVFEFWESLFLGYATGSLQVTVPGRDARVLALHSPSFQPFLIGTDMHLSMGAAEIEEAIWSYESQTLTGRARWRPGASGRAFAYIPGSFHLLPDGDGYLHDESIAAVRLDFDASGEAAWQMHFAQG
ncbi:MAG: hypothetical protein IT210_09565 [Armatimonadetes bacterium]|nr:hypothetical protein [Armatimonadota bacterium]